ncbi:hypothetical protein V3470_13535 [Flavobacterium oreochromis]|uniref:Rad50/SbcC-type AAA domain-containing protein n=1 Tax=Flavobacterium oreochromis TaxID=2906078 RepID=A0ABW8PBU1_9FLAO|nr:hypothetical protein [Flavobacterium oreochromis]OWP75390.1 hypothetical protein BWG23_11130 [Flavobacterium oreochromis]
MKEIIKSIELKNIKGFGEEPKKIQCNIEPNKSTFFVAPNGFGKSSITAGFLSLSNRNRIQIDKKNRHKKLDNIQSEFKLETSEGLYVTNNDKNEILKEFEIKVINNPIYPNNRKKKTESGFTVDVPEMKVPDIIIVEKIPEKVTHSYKVSEMRKLLNSKENNWSNINYLFENKNFICSTKAYLSVFKESKRINKNNQKFFENPFKITEENLDFFKNEEFDELTTHIKEFLDGSSLETVLIAIQMIYYFMNFNEEYQSLYNYYKYCMDKDFIDSFFYGDNYSWGRLMPKNIDVKDKKSNKIIYKNYGVEFPNADEISNGERDVVVFISSLLNSYISLANKKKKIILAIDEVFDYLDDANILIVQHFLNLFIQKCNEQGLILYPIIFTHLDPYYFKTYTFSKFEVNYLDRWLPNKDINLESLVILRNALDKRNEGKEKDLYNDLSKYFLHFHPEHKNLDELFIIDCTRKYKCKTNGQLKSNLDSSDFRNKVYNSVKEYVGGNMNYDPIATCIGLRVMIEEIVYNSLKNDYHKNEFKEAFETRKKLDKVSEFISIPSLFYTLLPIYNEVSHLRNEQDNHSRLFLKLKNNFIKKLIKDVYKMYKRDVVS